MQAEGINLEFRIMLLDNPKEKYPVLYASGTPFTFAFDAPWYFMNSLRDQGHLRPLEPYLEQYPNITKAIGKDVIDFNYMLGHLYGLPTGFYVGGGASGIVVSQRPVDKYGLPEPHNMDDLEVFLAEVQKNEPDMIPFGADDTFNAAYHGACPWREWLPTRHGYNPGGAMIGGAVEEAFNNPPKYAASETQPGCHHRLRARARLVRKRLGQQERLAAQGRADGRGAVQPRQVRRPGLQRSGHESRIDDPARIAVLRADRQGGRFAVEGPMEGATIQFSMLKQWNFQVFNSHMPEEDTKAGLKFFDWLLGSQDNIDIYLFGVDGMNYKKLDSMKYADLPDVDGTTNYRRRWYVAGVPGQFERVPEEAIREPPEDAGLHHQPRQLHAQPAEKFEPDRKPMETELGAVDGGHKEVPSAPGGRPDRREGRLRQAHRGLTDGGRDKVMTEFQTQLDQWSPTTRPSTRPRWPRQLAKYRGLEDHTFTEYIEGPPREEARTLAPDGSSGPGLGFASENRGL